MELFMQEASSFVTVLVVAICIASAISILYATGLRLWAGSAVDAEGNAHLMARLGSVVCFAACVVIVLFALWLMIPVFH